MKKFFILIAASLVAMTMSAQSLCFSDAEGNAYENGATITMDEAEVNEWDEVQVVLKNVYIKNTTDASVTGTLNVTVDKFAGDALQCCFGTSCKRLNKAGSLSITGVTVNAGAWSEINNTEWIAISEQYEDITAKFELEVNGTTVATLNVNFVYSDPAGINNVEANANANANANVYNIAGQRVGANANGLLIKNGKTYLVK